MKLKFVRCRHCLQWLGISLLLWGCEAAKPPAAPIDMLIYTGITMVQPIKEIAGLMEARLGVKITITQGGSEDLYQSLKRSQTGDLYLPGSASYRDNHLHEGLLDEFVHVGYNQAALFSAKGNPKGLTADLQQFVDPDIKVVIGDPESGSIGRETRRILARAGIYDETRSNSVFLATDSRKLNYAIKNQQADLIMNWRATGFFAENQAYLHVIDLPASVAAPKKLLINLLRFSQHPELARQFMQFAASEQGQAIFRKHGFLDNQMQSDQAAN